MKPLLLVIDMQNGFLGSRSKHIVEPVVNLISAWVGAMVFTQFFSLPGGQYERLIGWHRLQNPPETDLHQLILPYAERIFAKNYYSALTPQLSDYISANGFDTFLICGVATDSCVLKTAVDIFERGWHPVVVKDACASHGGEDAHNAAIYLLERFIGKQQLMSSSEALAQYQVLSE